MQVAQVTGTRLNLMSNLDRVPSEQQNYGRLSEESEQHISDHEEDEENEDEMFTANHLLFQEFDWLEPLNGKIALTLPGASDSEHKHIGRGFGELIRRGRMRHSFYDDLEQPSQDTSRLTFDLFDRYGQLCEEFKLHQVKTGSGHWGDEFDTGDLLLIENVFVKPSYRR